MVVTGIVEEIVYHNTDNNYTVAVVDNNGEMLTVVGMFPSISEGERLEMVGKFIKHPRYGEQFSVSSVKVAPPNSEDGIVKYLSSGLIKGVGPVTALNIVNTFGRDTLDIIEFSPHKLSQVRGISANKAREIAEAFKEIKRMQSAVMRMQEYGISTNLAVKIFNNYQDRTEYILETNPYKMVEDIDGIGFLTADKIAKLTGVDETSEFRFRAGIMHSLKQNSDMSGNTYMTKAMLISDLNTLLRINAGDYVDKVDKVLTDLVLDTKIKYFEFNGEMVVVDAKLYNVELVVAGLIHELMNKQVPVVDVSREIEIYEKFNNLKMHSGQKDAVDMAINSGVSVITGGPGTGKTTIVKCILQIFQSMGKNVKLLAPTGRASKRLSESTGADASTIHRALGVDMASPTQFNFNSGNKLPFDVVIVDEVSMVDINLAYFLLRSLKKDCVLVLVGDKDQLPSVGAGNVLSDILGSGVVPVKELTQIYRQDDKSLIVTNAHLINNGKMPIFDNKSRDFFFEELKDSQDILNSVIRLQTSRIPNYLNISSQKIQVLAPMKAGVCGVENLNRELQDAINPSSLSKQEIVKDKIIYRIGDRVMQTSNNYNKEWTRNAFETGTGVFNGDIGQITNVNKSVGEIEITFEDGRVARYNASDMDELTLSYAITIHKSQGSEFDVVIIPVVSGAYMLLTRNLLYTAVTRAKKMVVLVGSKKNIGQMVHNNYTEVRYSMLKDNLINYKTF